MLQGSTQEAYATITGALKVDVVAYANRDLIYLRFNRRSLDAALQDEVAASEGFPEAASGQRVCVVGPSVKDKKYFGDGRGWAA